MILFKIGQLGNCWLLAATSGLASRPELFQHVVPSDFDQGQGFEVGIFHFRFWRYGEWIDVVVDDRLPTIDGKLFLNKSDNENEFWPALLEKAYAKIHGSYAALEGGFTRDGFLDFSGACLEYFNFNIEIPDNLFDTLYKANQLMALMACSTPGKDQGKTNRHGLVPGHAYTITKVIKLKHEGLSNTVC